jgi:predicted ArsR family transcriptional regulator
VNREQATYAALASSARRRVLDAVVGSPDALDAQTIADLLALHVTTVRFHLEQLETAGLVGREGDGEKRRGRPRILFRSDGIARDESSREQMVTVLATALAERNDEGARAVEAGRRWAGALGRPATPDAAATLADAFDRLGFEPEVEVGEIRLHACPFRDAARRNPDVICSVHRGLIEGLLVPLGADASARLIPFVEPRLCVVALEGPTGGEVPPAGFEPALPT